jgi:hypothetical protein
MAQKSPSKYMYRKSPSVEPTLPPPQQQQSTPLPAAMTMPSPAASDKSTMRISDWLHTLDSSDTRKHITIVYHDFLQKFTDNDVKTLGELKELGHEGLQAMGLLIGTTQRLITYANEDIPTSQMNE